MYFIDIKGLKKDIVEKKFEEKDRFIYILLYIGLSALFMELLTSLPNDEVLTSYDYASSVIYVLLTFVGTYFIYKANGGNEGEDFAGKYFSITWVMSWRVILISIPMLIVFFFISSFQEFSPTVENIILLLWSIGIDFFIYFLSYKAVLEIRSQE